MEKVKLITSESLQKPCLSDYQAGAFALSHVRRYLSLTNLLRVGFRDKSSDCFSATVCWLCVISFPPGLMLAVSEQTR